MRASITLATYLFIAIIYVFRPVHADTLNFDSFLEGFDRECSMNASFNDFNESLIDRVYSNRKSRLPPDLRTAFGAAQILRRPSHAEVFIPLSGASWRGVPLAGLVFFIGNDNGINSKAVVFSGSSSEVRRVFGPSVNASARALKNDPNNITEMSIGFGTTLGKPSIICEMST